MKKLKLHPKIQELKNSEGSSPIRKSAPVKQPASISARIKADDDPRLLKQYFAVWGVRDDRGTMPVKGCFSKSIQERGPKSTGAYKITALYMHNQRDSVGVPIVLEEDEIGLYGEVPIIEGVQVADELVIRHKKGVCNNGSYGFDYVWDKMEYDEKTDTILMFECELFEVTFCTIGSQKDTFGVRSADGKFVDEFLEEDTEDFIKMVVPRKHQLEIRSIIDRHISLAKAQPLATRQKALRKGEPKQGRTNIYKQLNNLLKED